MNKLLANDSPGVIHRSCIINTSNKLHQQREELNLLASELPLYVSDTVKSSYILGIILR